MHRRRVHPLCLTASAAALSLMLISCGDGSEAQPSETEVSGSSTTEAAGAEEATSTRADATSSTPAEGEYVPASADGPAQNVPVPEKPPLADEESYEGAQAFLDYLSDVRAYAWETGDTSYVREITAPTVCSACYEEYENIENLYKDGGWSTAGRENIYIVDRDMPVSSAGLPSPRVRIEFEGIKVWDDNDGLIQDVAPDMDDERLVWMNMGYRDGVWEYISTSPVPL